jgi:hypothetical protein
VCCLVGVPQGGGRILTKVGFLPRVWILPIRGFLPNSNILSRKVEFELDNRSISFLYFFLCLLIDLEIAR